MQDDIEQALQDIVPDLIEFLQEHKRRRARPLWNDQAFQVSDSQGFTLDYRGYAYLFAYSETALTLAIPSIGNYTLSAAQWTMLPFREGLKLFTSGQATPVQVTVRATDYPIAQVISTLALPLPANAAQESGGNLAKLAGAMSGTNMNALLAAGTNLAGRFNLVDNTNTNLLAILANSAALVAQANNNASVPTGAGNTVVKASAGTITSIVVTTAGTGAGNVIGYDNATTNSGMPVAVLPATVSVGQQYQVNGYFKNGLTFANVASGPVCTVFFS